MAENSLPKSKRCPRCDQTKDASEFNTRWVDGRLYLSSKCRPCATEYAREIRKDPRVHRLHLEAQRRSKQKYADDPAHKLAIKEHARRDYAKNGKARRKAWLSTPEGKQKNSEQCRRWREKYPYSERSEQHKAKARAACRKGNLKRQQDPAWVAEDKIRNRAWVLANKDRARSYKIAYNNRKRMGGADDAAIKENFFGCLEAYRIGNQYWDVYESCLIDEPTIDHIVPLKSGGTNDIDNLCVTSKSNNSAKREASLLMYLWKRAVAM